MELGLLFVGILLSCALMRVNGVVEPQANSPACDFPAIYNFGDSNSDTGGISAAFQPIPGPYGEGFFHKPSGRDSDGRLVVDFIAEKVKLPYLSAYLNSLGTNYRHGANFATGGSTIRRQNETIFQYGISPFSLDIQIVQFNQFKARTKQMYQEASNSVDKSKLPVPEEFSKALYTFDIGQNDLSVGFRVMSFDQMRATMSDIVNQLASAVKNIYEQGGRSFWIHNTGPIGCLPVNLFYKHNLPPGYVDPYGCVNERNDMAVEFNKQLKDRVIKLRTELPEAAITYVDVYAAKYALISNTKNEGFVDPLKICCGYHVNDTHIWCGTLGSANVTHHALSASVRHLCLRPPSQLSPSLPPSTLAAAALAAGRDFFYAADRLLRAAHFRRRPRVVVLRASLTAATFDRCGLLFLSAATFVCDLFIF